MRQKMLVGIDLWLNQTKEVSMNQKLMKFSKSLCAFMCLPIITSCLTYSGSCDKKSVCQLESQANHSEQGVQSLNLNGFWEVGTRNNYDRKKLVPGIVNDPAKIDESSVWLRREIKLPAGHWTKATLNLKGARFNPKVYINGELVSSQKGGMAPTRHFLNHSDVRPGNNVIIELELASLKDMSDENASYIPKADHWRSNVSSMIWDDIELFLHGDAVIERMIPFTNLQEDKVDFHIYSKSLSKNDEPDLVKAELIKDEQIICSGEVPYHTSNKKNIVSVPFNGKIKLWSPEEPNLYKLRISLLKGKNIVDQREYNYGAKEFSMDESGYQFRLNGKPFKGRMVSVVWPRWVRNKEGHNLAWNDEWFKKNIVLRMKDLGANMLRFHLGNPPEKFIDMCDKYGLLVQYEWSFFHGMTASEESLIEQWADWMDLGLEHPSVGLIHPYNETYGDQLKVAWSAIDKIITDYPPLVLEERDVIHVHKYWWSLFENVGIYYDSLDQFPRAIMVDEFGGNYLDSNYDEGKYWTVKDTFRRFLGAGHTKEMRTEHHTLANVKIAEYWRRLGAAGYSPFCALGSHEDGSHWFEGDLKEGKPKPVWNELAVVYSPLAVSMNLWDQNFTPEQEIDLPLHWFNDTEKDQDLIAELTIKEGDFVVLSKELLCSVEAFSDLEKSVRLTMPKLKGTYRLQVTLKNRPKEVKPSVHSRWDFNVSEALVPKSVKSKKLAIPSYEKELIDFAHENKLNVVDPNHSDDFDVLLLSKESWLKIKEDKSVLLKKVQELVEDGKSVLILNAGPLNLGQGYPKDGSLGNLQGGHKVDYAQIDEFELLDEVKVAFKEIAEPESHIHAHEESKALWSYLSADQTWLWNGYKGGLIVPADSMDVIGQDREGFLKIWKTRGAEEEHLETSKTYKGFELEGFYAFSHEPGKDQEVKKALRDKVAFIVEDAPALAGSVNPKAAIKTYDLTAELAQQKTNSSLSIRSLAIAGKGMVRTPVVKVEKGNGKLIISQLLTAGRLADGHGSEGLYGVRRDPVAEQMVLNMLSEL